MRPQVRLAWLIPAWAWVDGSLVSGRQGSDTHPASTSVGPASGFTPEQEGNQRVRRKECRERDGEGPTREEGKVEEKHGGECAERRSDRPQD